MRVYVSGLCELALLGGLQPGIIRSGGSPAEKRLSSVGDSPVTRRYVRSAAETLGGVDVQYVPRSVCWLGSIAFITWGAAATLIGVRAAADRPAPIGLGLAIVAATLTVVAVEIAKRETPVRPDTSDDPTLAMVTRVRASVPTGRVYVSALRPRMAAEAVTTGGRGRGQDYWDAVADIAQTIFERRDDDPPPPP